MKKRSVLIVIALSLLAMTGCQNLMTYNKEESEPVQVNKEFIAASPGVYDSADTAVVTRILPEEGTITLKNSQIGREYTLNYDRMTYIYDKYNQGLSMEQIVPGEVVDVTFFKERKRLNSIAISASAWNYNQVSKFAIGSKGTTLTIVNEELALDKNLTILSQGQKIDLIDLNAVDILTVRGVGHKILSIVVDRGHGYLRLLNDEFFIGGWIEVGQNLIQPITEDMLLTVPEGSYPVLVTNSGNGGTKDVVIERNGEVALDIGDLKGEENKEGKIIFSATPTTASIYVDGNKVEVGQMVTLTYGIHQMIVKAEGYQTITQYLKVGQEMANIDVTMEKEAEKVVSENKTEETKENEADSVITPPSVSANQPNTNPTVSQNNPPGNTSSSTYKISITAPEGVEVYMDGSYMGISPVNFKKTSGTHVITLRKKGYETRSYTVQVDSENKDASWAFSELVKESE